MNGWFTKLDHFDIGGIQWWNSGGLGQVVPTQLEDIMEDDERPDTPHDFVMVEFEVPQSRDEPDPDAEADQTPKP